MFESVWNVLYFGSKKKGEKVVAGLALNLRSASPENAHHQPAPAGVFVPFILPCQRGPYLPQRGVSCDGPADSAHFFTGGIDSTRTKPNDVRCMKSMPVAAGMGRRKLCTYDTHAAASYSSSSRDEASLGPACRATPLHAFQTIFVLKVLGWCTPGVSGGPTSTPPPCITCGAVQLFFDFLLRLIIFVSALFASCFLTFQLLAASLVFLPTRF